MKKISLPIMIFMFIIMAIPCAHSNEKATKTQNITIENFAFNPPKLTIPVGTSVTWKNNDSVSHNIKSENFASKDLNEGETFSYTFNNKGTYSYICGIHPSMKGIIIVQ